MNSQRQHLCFVVVKADSDLLQGEVKAVGHVLHREGETKCNHCKCSAGGWVQLAWSYEGTLKTDLLRKFPLDGPFRVSNGSIQLVFLSFNFSI